MIKEILKYPKDKETLSQISQEVKDIKCKEIQNLIQDLKDTMYSNHSARGISAIQIGVPLRICVVLWGGDEYTLINPKIIRSRGQQDFLEGCLSVPNRSKLISRFQKVWIEYINENGEKKELAEGGWTSAIAQHELDHLDGICRLFEE